ncbi:fad binding domain-containing protein [Ophiostoma piceae UAMH 11346]|uniref:Fad binding domain-containing protein n=1 Tax=Ophiostoma piceae (strain UAMH 11346) TaxID=1262450 RepID=S3DA82_OPHP1|nr:fad binding domain-containing protein [Ophiostoma piceae UAMH 11346]
MVSYLLQETMLLFTLVPIFLCSVASAASLHPCRRDINESTPACRAIPGSASWPSPDLWESLNKTVGGRLLMPAPPGAVCHPGNPAYSALGCAALYWSSEFTHSEDPVSVEWNNWTNDTCIPIPSLPCTGYGYPVYVINATTPQHVKAGVDFARANNVRLIVKNSGHDYVGRSVAPHALSIWVHHMKGTELHETSFSPAGCSYVTIPGPALTALAGIQMLEAYEFTGKSGHVVVGGNGRTVALGGYITGGGHSILAPQYGLAADQVLEMDIVSPQGEILTLNECQNTDLFWAMRGGGGSTFGVMTSVTMKIFPSPEIVGMTFWIAASADNANAFDMIAYVVSQFPHLADAGISGYPIIFNKVKNFIDGSDTVIKGIIGKIIITKTNDASILAGKMESIMNHVNATWPGSMFGHYNTTYYPNFQAWYAENYDGSPTGYDNIMASRLLDRAALTDDMLSLKTALAKFSAIGQATVYIVSGKAVHEAQPRGGGNAVLPAWRRAYVHATSSIAYPSNNDTDVAIADYFSGFLSAAIRELAPDTGAYVNEASKFESDWQQTFWGDHYERLLSIKRSVDPTDVFWCTPCVGSERWEEKAGGRLCRV